MSTKYPHYLPAVGIYPLDACASQITAWTYDFPPPNIFDVDAEIEYIEALAAKHAIVAIGECGLDRCVCR
jgi:Tat protein secretion system quality control protein TatD with DNase activity